MNRFLNILRKVFLLLFYRNDTQLLTAPGKKDRDRFILQAVTGNAFMSLVGGVFLSGLYIHMDTPDSIMGYIPLVGGIAGIIMIFGGLIIERQKSRKRFVVVCNLLAKTLIAFVVWIPLLVSDAIAPYIMMIFTFVGFSLNALLSLAVSSWFVDAIDEGIRGRFMGVQHIFALIISASFPIIGGRFLDTAPDRYVAFCVIYTIAWVFMLTETMVFAKIHEPEFEGAAKAGLKIREVFLRPFKNKEFMKFVGMMMFFYMSWHLSFSFAQVYEIRYLEMSYTFLTAVGTLNPILQMIWYPLIGKMMDRYGSPFMVRLAFLLYFFHAFIYLFMNSNTYGVVFILLNISASFIGPIATLGIFNLRFKVIPKDGRTIYDGFFVSAIGISILIAPTLGNIFRRFLEANMDQLTFISFPQFRIMFFVSTVLVFLLYLYNMIKAKKETQLEAEKMFIADMKSKFKRRRA